jgi:peptidoglycan-associated lipoprotein
MNMKDFMRIVVVALAAAFLVACASKGGQTVESAPAPAPKPAAAPAPADVCADLGSALQENTILFDYDKSDVKDRYRAVAQAHGQCLARKPSSRVTIEGHADERGTREYNLALGERRGNAIGDMLMAAGASAGQINTISYGEERPVCTQSDESCWQRNRRGVFVYTAR